MKWSPGKFTIVKWDNISFGLPETALELWYDTLFQLKGSNPRRKGRYVFTSLHLFRVLADDKEVFDYSGRVEYDIQLEGMSLDVDLLILLVDRTHRLFSEEFDKRKKTTPWTGYEIPDYDPSSVRNELVKIM